ncbi:hypothetical protein CHS0354_025179 [Potamilus streckersoni]|uniref:Uncharacterized protein n=1 Tax=Potamilus streckersoni TaxID=2493646 RepID=A0AAE0VEY6_9BIVA|nr:hypothetical protein CHS0354_025179 [Potamilus streckersoni]
MLGFTREIQYDSVDWSDKTQTSLYGNLPFIAPFFYNALSLEKVSRGYGGRIHYREFNQGSAQTPTLYNLSSYIKATVVGSDDFNAVWGIQVTWANVTHPSWSGVSFVPHQVIHPGMEYQLNQIKASILKWSIHPGVDYMLYHTKASILEWSICCTTSSHPS